MLLPRMQEETEIKPEEFDSSCSTGSEAPPPPPGAQGGAAVGGASAGAAGGVSVSPSQEAPPPPLGVSPSQEAPPPPPDKSVSATKPAVNDGQAEQVGRERVEASDCATEAVRCLPAQLRAGICCASIAHHSHSGFMIVSLY